MDTKQLVVVALALAVAIAAFIVFGPAGDEAPAPGAAPEPAATSEPGAAPAADAPATDGGAGGTSP